MPLTGVVRDADRLELEDRRVGVMAMAVGRRGGSGRKKAGEDRDGAEGEQTGGGAGLHVEEVLS